jgi:mono/diheme cytochrome c family protein
LYEAGVNGDGLSQLTFSPNNDCEPFYLPNGQIGFTSDRAEQVVMCGSDIHVASLFTMNADGSEARQLGFNVFNEFNPSVLPDGRIIYNRWEYNERSVTTLHDLFTIHPDGTHAAPYYGNATIRPNVIMFPRAVPGTNKVMALFTGHHGQTHGPLGLIDVSRGMDGPSPITVLTPGVPVIGEKVEDSRRGWFSDPRPLSETTFLCSYTPTVLPWLENSWAIYVGDRHGNLALVYRDPKISCAEPIPLVPRSHPAILAASAAGSEVPDAEATLTLLDVYRGLPDVPRGAAKYLRVLEDVPRKGVPRGGVICTSGTRIYTIKRVFGAIPIDPDGSAHFTVPANRNLYFEVLDENHREIQRMRSVVCLKPNEHRSCVGCHEPRTQTPPNEMPTAMLRAPSQPAPPPWGTQTLSFLRDVQPLLNDKCVQCHTHDRTNNGVILTDDLTDQFTVGYEELLPYLSVANAMRWDHPDDVYPQSPYTFGSNRSRLTKLLLAGHHGTSLTDQQWRRLAIWIDTNAVYYDRYETYTNDRHIFTDSVDEEMHSVYDKRCAECHGDQDDGRFGAWWRSINRHDVTMSRALRAPLAQSVGGWQRCEQIVFADASDPDYQRLLAALTKVRDTLSKRPRADLRSLKSYRFHPSR